MLGGVDERGQFARRMRDLISLHVDDLSGGSGASALSEAQLSLVRRAVVLEMTLEIMEMGMANGETVNVDQYARVAGHLRRVFETVGIRRMRRDVTPPLHAYVRKQVAREHEQEGGIK